MTAAHLLPCPDCNRHVRIVDPVCPFCGHALPMAYRTTAAPAGPLARLGRAATFAFGAAVATSVAAGCSSRAEGRGFVDGGMIATDSGGGGTGDAGSSPMDGGGTTDAGGGGTDGGPAPTDAGTPARDGGRSDAGIPVTDGGPAVRDGGGIMPLYGASPPE